MNRRISVFDSTLTTNPVGPLRSSSPNNKARGPADIFPHELPPDEVEPVSLMTEPAEGCPATNGEISYDQYDLIVQRDCDGGDTAQREGMYWLAQHVRVDDLKIPIYGEPRKITYPQVIALMEDPQMTGKFRRHPFQPKWSDPINSYL